MFVPGEPALCGRSPGVSDFAKFVGAPELGSNAVVIFLGRFASAVPVVRLILRQYRPRVVAENSSGHSGEPKPGSG